VAGSAGTTGRDAWARIRDGAGRRADASGIYASTLEGQTGGDRDGRRQYGRGESEPRQSIEARCRPSGLGRDDLIEAGQDARREARARRLPRQRAEQSIYSLVFPSQTSMPVGLEDFASSAPGREDAGLDRSLATGELGGDVGIRPALELVQDERYPVAHRQRRDRRGDLALDFGP